LQETSGTAETPEADTTKETAGNGVTVKGWRNGLILALPSEGAWDAVVAQVDAKLDEAKARSFWRGAQTTIDCANRPGVTLDELTILTDRIKRAYGLVPVAVITTDPQTRAAGEKLVLTVYAELPVVKKPERAPYSSPSAPRVSEAEKVAAAAPAAPANNALYVSHTIRSGQRVVHEGHLIICGDVNAGAEVMAGGDILVFGTLRGLAHAGCYGDETARIVAGSLRPPQLRIAGKIARSPEEAVKPSGGSAGMAARVPEVARVENGEIQVFPL
jgi:septum site-determining protein MinC